MMKNKVALLISATLLVGGLAGCSSSPTVSRVDTGEEIALTDKWNATDSQLVAEEMIKDMMTFPWLNSHYDSFDNPPAVIVQRIRNKSHEHIASETFVNELKRAMLRTGEVEFVASGAEREDVRNERADQELNASLDSQAEMGEERGADYALSGSINSFVDQVQGERVTFYQVDLKLIDMTTNREVWNGQKKIQKLQQQKRFSL